MLAGPIRHKVKVNHSQKFAQQVVVSQLDNQPPNDLLNPEKRLHIADVYSWLVNDKDRNTKIVRDVIGKINEGKFPLVLTERREHAEVLNQLLIDNGLTTVVLRGAMRVKEQKRLMNSLVMCR